MTSKWSDLTGHGEDVETGMHSESNSEEVSKPIILTVVIPCRNEVRGITAVLADLDRQDFFLPFEVIVADGNSEDGTRDVLDEILRRAPFRYSLHLVDNPRTIIPTGLNLAVARAEGEFIVRIDAHSLLPEDYLRTIFEALESRVGDVVGPQVVHVATSEMPVARTIAAMLNSRFGNGGTTSRNRIHVPTRVTHTVMSCYRRNVWEAIGGYDESLLANEDYEFDYRANRAGFSVVSLPGPVFRLIARATLSAFVRQRWRYGRWKSRVLIMHPGSIKLRQIIPMLIVPAAISLFFAGLPLVLLVALVYSAMAAYSVVTEEPVRNCGVVRKTQCAVLAPLVAGITHLVWGAGAWFGLIFRPRSVKGRLTENRQAAQ